MQVDNARLRKIFEHSSGHCHLCGEPCCFVNYGKLGRRGAWEIEHSNAQANGGTDHLNNLYPAHISCNRAKRDMSTRTARAMYGRTKAPLSKAAVEKQKERNAWVGAGIGFLTGLRFGPVGGLIGALIGGLVGSEIKPSLD